MESCILSYSYPKLTTREIIAEVLVSVAGFNVITIVIYWSKNNQNEIILTELNPTITGPHKSIARDLEYLWI